MPAFFIGSINFMLVLSKPTYSSAPVYAAEEYSSNTKSPTVQKTVEYEVGTPILDCGDFEVLTDREWHVTNIFYFDKKGTPIRERWSVVHKNEIFYNSVYPDICLMQGEAGTGANQNLWVDLVTGDMHSTGKPLRLFVPDYGPVSFMAGNWWFDAATDVWSFNGRLVWFNDESSAATCEYLSL